MSLWQALATMALFVLVGIALFMVALRMAQVFMGRKVAVSQIFVGLKPKLWMTFCLGLFFFALYLLAVVFLSYYLDEQNKKWLFQAALKNPTSFVYAGLTLFVCISISIIAVRSAIKKFYNAKIR